MSFRPSLWNKGFAPQADMVYVFVMTIKKSINNSEKVFLPLPLSKIKPDDNQPRQNFGPLDDLKASIAVHGLIQPIIVSSNDDGSFRIISGHRRFQACRELKLETIPALIRNVDEQRRLEVQLIENLHRKDLTPFEEAQTFRRLIDDLGITQKDLAKRLGKSISDVNQTLSILDLPGKCMRELQTSETLASTISKSLLIELVKLPDDARVSAWEKAKKGALTVREARTGYKEYEKRSTSERIKLNYGTVTVRLKQGALQSVRKALYDALKLL